jgi:hypothetical protein
MRRYIPEDITLHNNRCDNLKFYVLVIVPPRFYKHILPKSNIIFELNNDYWINKKYQYVLRKEEAMSQYA